MFRYLFFSCILTTSFPQIIDERFLLNETQKILTYMDTFEQFTLEEAQEYAVSSNVANSIAGQLMLL